MDIKKIKIGEKAPDEFNVIIEIPAQEGHIKYEFDKDAGVIIVDRFNKAPMYYPCNYGFIPHTLSNDGDPCDVLVLTNFPIIPGCVIKVRPVAVLLMTDESGEDEKILAVPTTKIDSSFDHIKDINDINKNITERIQHFFENYKKLDKNKWVKVEGWKDCATAKTLINKSIVRAKKTST